MYVNTAIVTKVDAHIVATVSNNLKTTPHTWSQTALWCQWEPVIKAFVYKGRSEENYWKWPEAAPNWGATQSNVSPFFSFPSPSLTGCPSHCWNPLSSSKGVLSSRRCQLFARCLIGGLFSILRSLTNCIKQLVVIQHWKAKKKCSKDLTSIEHLVVNTRFKRSVYFFIFWLNLWNDEQMGWKRGLTLDLGRGEETWGTPTTTQWLIVQSKKTQQQPLTPNELWSSWLESRTSLFIGVQMKESVITEVDEGKQFNSWLWNTAALLMPRKCWQSTSSVNWRKFVYPTF